MRKIDIKYLAIENIRKKPMRSLGLILLVALFAMTVLAGSLISLSLSRGIGSMSDRLGADVMVIPQGHEVKFDTLLLKGSPSEFYLPKNTTNSLKSIEGIEKITPQTYIATLSASCCSYPVQIIGIDSKTDFLITPWLETVFDGELHTGEVIVGNRVEGEVGQIVRFFEQPYKIVAKLEQTGMGFDASVFVNNETAKAIAADSQRIKKHPLSEDEELISTVMIKLKAGYDPKEVAQEITNEYSDKGVYAIFSKNFVSNISSNLKVIVRFIQISVIVVWILSAAVLAAVFSMILRERKKEFATLRILGAAKKQIRYMLLKEMVTIGNFGAIIGIVLGYIFIFFYGSSIADNMSVPFLMPKIWVLIMWGVLAYIISVLIAPVSSIGTIRKLSKWDIYNQFREDE